MIRAGRKIAIDHGAGRASLVPVRVKFPQLVTKAHCFRIRQAHSGVVDLHAAGARGENQRESKLVVLIVARDRLDCDWGLPYFILRTKRIEPQQTIAHTKPQVPVCALNGSRQRAYLSRDAWDALSSPKMLAFDPIRGVFQSLRDFCSGDVKNPGKAIEPQVAIGCFDDSRDSAEQFVIYSVDVMKASLIKLLKSELAADPDFRSAAVDCCDVTHANPITRTEYLDAIVLEECQLVPGEAEPHAPQAVCKLANHPGLWQVVAATVECPDTICQSVQATAPQRDPHSSERILGYCLQKVGLICNFRRKVGFNPITTGKTPKRDTRSKPFLVLVPGIGGRAVM